MTQVRFYEARKQVAATTYKEVISFAKSNQLQVDDLETPCERLADLYAKIVHDGKPKHDHFARIYAHAQWYKASMPFYRVYPAFQKQLIRLGDDFINNLNVFSFDFDQVLPAIAIEFPVIDEPYHVCEMTTALKKGAKHKNEEPHLLMFADFWYKKNGEDRNVTFTQEAADFITVSEKKSEIDSIPYDVFTNALKTYASILAIGDNPDLLQPIPLRDDRLRYEETLDPKLVEKAKRRGVFGFEVGKIFEDEERLENVLKKERGTVIPHYRKSHLAWQAHGPNHSLRKLILKKGAKVNFEKVKTVPMGYYGKDTPQSGK